MFRRRRKADESSEAETSSEVEQTPESGSTESGSTESGSTGSGPTDGAEKTPSVKAGGKTPRPDGPWDASEVDDAATGRIDLGGLLVPGVEGIQLRVDVDKKTSKVVAVTLVLNESTLQLQAFAAPRNEGVWDDIRGQIRAGITEKGGLTKEVGGAFGTELHVRIPVKLPDGKQGAQPLRFLGVDGPRWFLRGVLSGRAAHDPARAEQLEQLFRKVVVVRGGEAMSPREQIPLRLPAGAAQQGQTPASEGTQAGPALNPFARGPEITELR